MRLPSILILLPTLVLFVSSCNFYKPTLVTAPILKEKGQLDVGLGVGSSVDATAAYAITNHIAVTASAGGTGTVEIERSIANGPVENFSFKNNKYEGSIGYFSHKNEEFYYNLFVGYAQGHAGAIGDDIILLTDGAYGAEFQAYTSQASIHSKLSDKSYLGLIGRINHLRFSNFDYSYDPSITGLYEVRNNTAIVGQVALDYKIEGKKVGGYWQAQYAFKDNYERYMSLRRLSLHMGIYLRLQELLK